MGLGFLVLVWTFHKFLPASWALADKVHLYAPTLSGWFYAAMVAAVFIGLFRTNRAYSDRSRTRISGRLLNEPALIVFPCLILLNGLGPYLGGRTQISFSMFSNLHTEGGVSNHLLVPASIQFIDWQQDLVEIVDSNDPTLLALRDDQLRLPYLELRRRRTITRVPLTVSFRRGDSLYTFDLDKQETHTHLPALNPIARRFLYFRPVEFDHLRVRCRH